MVQKKKGSPDNEAAIAELKNRIKTGECEGLYIFTGEEEYMKRYYFSELCRAAGDAVNVSVLRGSVDYGELCDELVSVPVMEFSLFDEPKKNEKSGMRVIKLDSPDFSSYKDKELTELYEVLCNAGEHAAVVLYFSDFDSTKKLSTGIFKKIAEVALPCDFRRYPPDSAVLLRWIKKHFDKAKIAVSADVIRYMTESIGNDMCLLDSETSKLLSYLACVGKTEVTREDVDAVCIKNREAVTFDVTNALTDGNFEKAVQALSILKAMKEDPLMIFGAIAKNAADLTAVAAGLKMGKAQSVIASECGLHPYVVQKQAAVVLEKGREYPKKLASLCAETDARLKGFALDGFAVLEEFLFKAIIG